MQFTWEIRVLGQPVKDKSGVLSWNVGSNSQHPHKLILLTGENTFLWTVCEKEICMSCFL